jgi:hypothetical protein
MRATTLQAAMSHGTFLAAFLFTAGCAASSQRPATLHDHGHDHDHGGGHAHAQTSSGSARDAMFPTLAGDRLVMLTAHLAADGHELDIFFEDRARQTSAVSDQRIEAIVYTRGGERAVTFECAPAAERPAGEPDGMCSHFVAKAPWLVADETVKIAGRIALAGVTADMRWQGFKPAKYAHHDDRRIASKR